MRTRANDPNKVQELMDSIKEIGLQVPVTTCSFLLIYVWNPCIGFGVYTLFRLYLCFCRVCYLCENECRGVGVLSFLYHEDSLGVVWVGLYVEMQLLFYLIFKICLLTGKVWVYKKNISKTILMDMLEWFFSGSSNSNICVAFHTVNWLLSVPIMIEPVLEMSGEKLLILSLTWVFFFS